MTALVAAGAAEFEAALIRSVRDSRMPGAAAGVVHGGELAWSAAAGFADIAARRPATPQALYRIASITKTLTGTAIMALRDAGQLGLDDPAVAYLPELAGAHSPYAPVEAITIRRMLSHQSGLATEPRGTDWTVPAYQGDPAQTLASPASIHLRIPPSVQHKYSDLAYQLLGEVVTRVSGVPYPQYLREAVLDPLGMTATGFEPLAGPLLDRRATGYDWRTLTDELTPAPATPPVWAEGGLWSCVPDLARWLAFQLSAYVPGPAGTTPVLAPASLREMHRPYYLADETWTSAWGISWCANRRDDAVWIQHSGWVPGFISMICFDPGSGVGAVVLVNGNCEGVDLAQDLAGIARRLVREAPPLIGVPEPAPDAFRPLLGVYTRPSFGGWMLRLEWRDGQLAFISPEVPGFALALTPTGDPDVFIAGPGSNFAGEEIVFRRRADGRVTSVLLAETTMVRLEQVAADPG